MSQVPTGRTTKIWRDGELVNWDDARIHVISHVVHYGSSLFEGMRCYATP
ncbi:MAG: branched chain amino acid aminotransferase, partial [Gemmatimonadaceae bacterium]